MEPKEQGNNNPSFAIRKTYVYIALALIIGFGGGFGVAKFVFGPAPASETQAPATAQVAIEGRPSLGPADARVTIVEFTDYQCPFCGRHFRQTLPQSIQRTRRFVLRSVLG